MRGRSHVYVTKDRPGHLRRHGRVGKTPGKTYIGELVVDDTETFHNYLDLRLFAPSREANSPGEDAGDPRDADDAHVLDVLGQIQAQTGSPVSLRTVRAKSHRTNERTADALERLTLDGEVSEQPGPRNARLFAVTDRAGERSSGPVLKDRGPTGPLDAAVVTGLDHSRPVDYSETSTEEHDPFP
jgi:hypothetical protein